MLDYVTIKNFKSHADSDLEFHKGFNAIVGISTSGKTPILQAIRLVSTNRPLGFGYKNIHAPKKDGVEVSVGIDGSIVSFTKTVNGANYNIASVNELDTKSNKDEEFGSFGTSVPEPVLDLLNLSELNFRHGSSSRSILTSPTEFAQIINKITGAEEARRVVKNIKRMTASTAKEQSLLIERLRESKQKISQCQKVKKLKPYIIQAKRLSGQIESKEDEIISIENIVELKRFFLSIEKTKKALRESQSEVAPLVKLDELQKYIQKVEHIIDLKSVHIEPGLAPFVQELNDAAFQMHTLQATVQGIKDLVLLVKKQISIQSEQDRVKAELSQFKNCDVCGKPLD